MIVAGGRRPARLVNSVARQVAYRSYASAKAYARLRFGLSMQRRMRKGGEQVLVYQMGKTGSMTVRDSLRRAGGFFFVHHVHTLRPEQVKEDEMVYRTTFTRRRRIPRRIISSEYLCDQIRSAGGKGKRWTVVTGAREPISMNVATFFQILRDKYPALDYDQMVEDPDVDRVAKMLMDIFINEYDLHELPLEWFDTELKPVLGVDVYASEFPTPQGYKIYEGDRARVLLIRLENLNACAGDAFKEFLGISDFRLVNTNLSSDKEYYALYRKFMDLLSLPQFYIDRMYSSRYATHFYSPEEIASFRKRWSRA